MASLYKDVYSLVLTFPDVVDLIGFEDPVNGSQQIRLHPLKLPQSPTFPAIVQNTVTDISRYTNDGLSAMGDPIIQFTCWANTHDESNQLADVFESYLSGYRGIVGERNCGGVFRQNRVDLSDPQTALRAQVLDYRFLLKG
jgi:hypothetical protein